MGIRGNGLCEMSFASGTGAEFAIHHVRAVIRRHHSDGHLAFVVVITFRVIVVVI
jgi:hypothetical protein